MPSSHSADPNVWPAHLPARARWLPYSQEERARQWPASVPPPPPPPPAPRRHLLKTYWRALVVTVIGAGLVGIGGGLLVGQLAR